MVESLYFVPEWFFNIDILLGILFVLITGIVAGYAFKIYRLTRERKFQLFAAAFSMLSLSYLLRILLNVVLTKVAEGPRGMFLVIFGLDKISEVIIYTYVLLFILGYLTLAYTGLKTRSRTLFVMLAIMIVLAVLDSAHKTFTFYFISSLFLVFISYHYYHRVSEDPKNKNQKRIFYSMLLLLLSNVLFIFIGGSHFYYGYIVAEAIELSAYGLIAFTLFKTINHGKKTR